MWGARYLKYWLRLAGDSTIFLFGAQRWQGIRALRRHTSHLLGLLGSGSIMSFLALSMLFGPPERLPLLTLLLSLLLLTAYSLWQQHRRYRQLGRRLAWLGLTRWWTVHSTFLSTTDPIKTTAAQQLVRLTAAWCVRFLLHPPFGLR